MQIRPLLVTACGLALLLLAGQARSQPHMRPDGPDRTLTAPERQAVLDSMCSALRTIYVFPEVAEKTIAAVRTRDKRGEYARLTSSRAFAESLTVHLRAVTHDLHLHVDYSSDPLPGLEESSAHDSAAEAANQHFWSVRNFGFERVERLRGNIGYLELRGFRGEPGAAQVAVAAMNFLSNTEAMIIDLRENGGGTPSMIALLLTYFHPDDNSFGWHFNDFFSREENRTTQFWTLPYVPGPRYDHKPIFVLTSRMTFSAAEEFAYDVQTLKIGTLVGEVTGGGAHPVTFRRLTEHLAGSIPFGRAVNPITRTNWERVGVKPEILVSSPEALRTGYVAALKSLRDSASNKDDQDRFAQTIQQFEAGDYLLPVSQAPPRLR